MKSKMYLFVMSVLVSQFGWVASLHATDFEGYLYAGGADAPSIFYDQYFNRGDKLKKSYREFTGQSYEDYSKRFREENVKESYDEDTEKYYDDSSVKSENSS